jgi:hypothetical protein
MFNVIQTTRARIRLTAVVLVFLASSAEASDQAPAPRPSPRVVKFLGERAAETLAGATRVEVFRVSSKRAEEGEAHVGGYRVVEVGKEQGESFARRLAAVLLDEKTYDFEKNKVGGFKPAVGLRLWKEDETVEVLLSFDANELVVLSHNPKDRSTRSAQEDFDAAHGALFRLVKEALPPDRID